MFKAGHKKIGGRKIGSLNKDSTNYLDLQLWFKEAKLQIAELKDAEKKLPWIIQLLDKIMAKVPVLPISPSESRENALARQAILGALEAPKLDPIPAPLENKEAVLNVPINS